MRNFQRIGGVAALIAAGTYLVGITLLLGFLAPAGYGTPGADPGQIVAFLVENQAVMYSWHLIIYVINSVVLVVLALALFQRLQARAPALAQIATAFGLIWAALVLGSGMLANVGLAAVVDLYGRDPNAAATLWLTLSTVENGLGGGNEIAGGLWILLLSWAGHRSAALPRLLNYLGLLIGLSGLLTVIPALALFGAVFGLGFIVWFIWVGLVLLRGDPAETT